MDARSGTSSTPQPAALGRMPRAVRVPILFAIGLIAIYFGIFGVWASVAPLASAAVATGVFNADSNRKSIQHLEGGIIREIHVAEGRRVIRGQLLVTLDETAIDKDLQKQLTQQALLSVRIGRLMVEQRAASARSLPVNPVLPAESVAAAGNHPRGIAIVEAEQNLLASRTAVLRGKIASLLQSVNQQEAEIRALEARGAALADLVQIIGTEIDVADDLFKKQLNIASKVNSLKKEGLGRKEELLEVRRQSEKLAHSIISYRLQIDDQWNSRLNEVNDELARSRSDLNTVEEDIRGLRDKLDRTKIRSPVDGTIVGLKVFTIGGVIAPGAVLMEVVPHDDRLIVDARVDPNDIEGVHAGLPARVSLLAYSAREVAMAQGTVLSVSADTLTGEDNKKYYLAKVEIDGRSLGKTGSGADVRIAPGMNVEVLILKQPRTLLVYLLDPLIRSLRRSMVES